MISDKSARAYMRLALTKSNFHPTKVLFDAAKNKGVSIDQISKDAGIDHDVLFNIMLGEQRITLEIAQNLGAYFNNPTSYWLDIQKKHDVKVAEVATALQGHDAAKYFDNNDIRVSEKMEIQIKRLPHAKDLPLPKYQTAGSAGFDLYAAINGSIRLDQGRQVSIQTGLCVAVPEGYELQVRPRSGLAAKYGISVVNSPGTIDSDYRGELIVLLVNTHWHDSFLIKRGDRIAQAVVSPVVQVKFLEVDELPETMRGEGGFGSTGV